MRTEHGARLGLRTSYGVTSAVKISASEVIPSHTGMYLDERGSTMYDGENNLSWFSRCSSTTVLGSLVGRGTEGGFG